MSAVSLQATANAATPSGPAADAVSAQGRFAGSFLSGTGAGFGDAVLRERRTGLALRLAERIRSEQSIDLGLRYDYTRYLYRDLASRNRDLHRLSVPVSWRRLDARWQVELGFPSSRIDWQPDGGITLGAALFPDGGHWNVVSDERDGASFDYRVRTWRSVVSAGWSPWPGVRVDLQGGLAFRRRHRFEDDTGAVIDRRADPARFWGLVLAWQR